MSGFFIFLFLLVSTTFIYFLFMVSIQFTRINKINLQLGMDVTKLYSIDEFEEDVENDFYFNYLVRKSAMLLYKLSIYIK